MPARLSGGQAHRVALGRLLLAHCDALLLDEPYTGLDASAAPDADRAWWCGWSTDREVPAMLVAHELADAQAFADRLAVSTGDRAAGRARPTRWCCGRALRRVAELVGYLGFVPWPGQIRPRGWTGRAYPDRGVRRTLRPACIRAGDPAPTPTAGWC